MSQNYEPGRVLHSVITGCDDVWAALDAESKQRWIDDEARIIERVQPEKMTLAREAVQYVLSRIKRDENIRYHMGAFTEAFEKLKAANCAIVGVTPESLEAEIFGYKLSRTPYAKKIDEIRDLLDNLECGQEMQMEIVPKIKAIISR